MRGIYIYICVCIYLSIYLSIYIYIYIHSISVYCISYNIIPISGHSNSKNDDELFWVGVSQCHKQLYHWLVVWNIAYVSIYWEQEPQLTNIFSEGLKPPTSYSLCLQFFEEKHPKNNKFCPDGGQTVERPT